jgi:hypothetical protein
MEEIILVIPEFLRTIEQSGLAGWLRDSSSWLAYPAIITLHTFGLALVAGLSVGIDLRILGVAPQIPLAPLGRFFPVMWLGFWVNAVSGFLLMIAYPTKALPDPVLSVQLGFVAAAMVYLHLIRNRVFRHVNPAEGPMAASAKNLAAVSLLWWFGAIFAGKFVEYTYTNLIYPG